MITRGLVKQLSTEWGFAHLIETFAGKHYIFILISIIKFIVKSYFSVLNSLSMTNCLILAYYTPAAILYQARIRDCIKHALGTVSSPG